jgi:hypothetical protein
MKMMKSMAVMMTMGSKRVPYLAILLLFVSASFAQKDTLVPLSYNPVLQQQSTQEDLSNLRLMITGGDTMMELPFYDDFSKPGPYPDTARWMKSRSVYVNRTYGYNPRTLGVATFDGLKATGYPYKPFGSSAVENSDTLTSKYIRLDSITSQSLPIVAGDSLYLSFHYQPTGYGRYPGSTHTLILDFFNPTTQAWVTKMTLSRSGTSITQTKDTVFTKVMIPITDPQYLKKNFRFRFRNKSAGTGAVNHWNIDNVYLGKDRFRTDTTIRDLSYVYPAQSLLEQYSAIPYNQYTGASQMAAHSYLKIRNNDVSPVNFTGFMEVRDNTNSVVVSDTTGTDNALPFYPNGYVSNPDITDPLTTGVSPAINNYAFNNGNTLSDSITYTVKHSFASGGSDFNKGNDTLVHKQIFHNYFAYDDGSAELAYGLQDPSFFGAQMAVKYGMSNPDVLRAVDIFFNPVPSPGSSVDAQTNLLFGLRVWSDNGGVPGTILYDDNNSALRSPNYYQWGPTNYFTRYYLNYPISVSAGTFYVGVEQDGIPSLNIGFDQNTNRQSKTFYNVGTWTNASFKGTLMIRPVFGDSAWAATGVKQEVTKATNVLLYPNPATDKLFIKMTEPVSDLTIELIDALGKTQIKQAVSDGQSVSVAELEPGFYFARVYSGDQLIKVRKIIVSH